jgi:hypothetical protein
MLGLGGNPRPRKPALSPLGAARRPDNREFLAVMMWLMLA